eukprot:5754138-Amphidinium_carterae.2
MAEEMKLGKRDKMKAKAKAAAGECSIMQPASPARHFPSKKAPQVIFKYARTGMGRRAREVGIPSRGACVVLSPALVLGAAHASTHCFKAVLSNPVCSPRVALRAGKMQGTQCPKQCLS